MTNQERASVFNYIYELEAAALNYAVKYGLTREMNQAISTRPADSVWAKLTAPADRAPSQRKENYDCLLIRPASAGSV